MTPKQRGTLALIEAGAVRMINAGSAAFRIVGGNPTVVGRLVALGWARWPKGAVGEQTCEIAPAGRAALDRTTEER